MTETDTEGGLPGHGLRARSESLLAVAAGGLGRAPGDSGTGEDSEIRAVIATAREIESAFRTVQEQRGRFDKLVKQSTGVVTDHILDIHAARDEIGRRLACLRGAAGH